MYISAVQLSLKGSYRNPDSGIIVKEGQLGPNLWIIETWKKAENV